MTSKILMTGGSGDLACVLTPRFVEAGDLPIRLDIRPPVDDNGHFVEGSILNLDELIGHMADVDCVVHIAAWHGIHELREEHGIRDFLELNVGGTVNVFEAALKVGLRKIVLISSTSAEDKEGIYGPSKRMAEIVAQSYFEAHDLQVITLRPRAFIPHWNKDVYGSYVEWAKWFWPGAVHIDDVAGAVERALKVLQVEALQEHHILPLDSKYEYSDTDLENWDADGPGSSFEKHYSDYQELVLGHGLDPAIKPIKLDISKTESILGYAPRYSLLNLLQELASFGLEGPPRPF
jgi:nucleoside-diphosphate-sugar epimerase